MQVAAKRKRQVLPALMLLLWALSMALTSPLHPLSKLYSTSDSAFFVYFGQNMSRGLLPYRDIFDHKGPLLFLIEWLGYMMGGKAGIWLIGLSALFLSALFMYKMLLQFYNTPISLIATIFVFIALAEYFQKGNLTEHYSLPFLCAALYIFSQYYKGNQYKIPSWMMFVSGICFGCVAMIRVNMVILWIGYFFCIAVHMLLRKQIIPLIKMLVWFVSGIAISILPIIAYLFYNNIAKDCWEVYILINILYVQNEMSLQAFFNTVVFYLQQPPQLLISCAVSILWILIKCTNRSTDYQDMKRKTTAGSVIQFLFSDLISVNFFVLLVTFFIMVLPCREYMHYAMFLMPMYVLPCALLIHYLHILIPFTKELQKYSVMIVTLAVIGTPLFLRQGYDIVRTLFSSNRDVQGIINQIELETTADDFIFTACNAPEFYVETNRRSPSRHIVEYQVNAYPSLLLEEFLDDITSSKPKLIIEDNGFPKYMDFLIPEYKLIYGTAEDKYRLYKHID